MLHFNPNLEKSYSQFSNVAYQEQALDNKNKTIVLFSLALALEDGNSGKRVIDKSQTGRFEQ